MLEFLGVQEAMLAQDCIAEKLTGLRGEECKNAACFYTNSRAKFFAVVMSGRR